MKWLQLISASVIILVATLVASDAVAGDIPEETAQPCVWISSADECATSGDIPIGSPVPVYDELDVYQLPNTGVGSTAREVKVSNHVGWHYVSSYCSYGYYRNLYSYAYYWDGWSHLFSQRWEQNTWYRC